MTNKLKIMVTGSNGLLGQKITDAYFRNEDFEIIATATGPNRHPEKGKFTYESMDICDHVLVREIISRHRPDALIHAAAMTNVDACETEQDTCTAINVNAVQNLAQLCSEFNVFLVHVSTDFIFDGLKTTYTEDDKPNPLSFYGNSKLSGEEMVHKYASHSSILRTSLVYGVVADMSRSNIVLWAYNTLKNRVKANVVDDQFRTPTLAEDLAQGCILAASKQIPGIFNIAGRDYMSIYDLVSEVALYFKLSMSQVQRVKSTTLNQPAKRPPSTGLDISKARRQLGYVPHSFLDGLAVVASQLGLNEE